MDIRFDGKKALVTGAGKGIGRCLALKLAELGAEVVAISRTQADLDSLKEECSSINTLCLDVSMWDATKAVLESSVGPIDLLVNNAAVAEPKPYGEVTEEEVDNMFTINVKSIVNITQLIAEGMKARGEGGAIVNVSSVMGLYIIPSFGVYCSSKGAVHQLTRGMAAEYGPHNIRVNSVNPTVVDTPMARKVGIFEPDNELGISMKSRTPLRRFAEPEDIVYPILFLLSDKAAMVNGAAVPVDGGLSVLYS